MDNNEIVQLKSYDDKTGKEIGNVLPITNSEAVKVKNNKKLTEILTELDNKIEQTNASLDNKANVQEVFLKKYGININDFDEETRKTFLEAQGIDVNYVLGKNAVSTSNLGEQVVTGGKLGTGTLRLIGGFTTSVDIFPELAITTGKFISWTSGQELSNEIYFCSSDYIDIIPGSTVEFSHGVKGAFYSLNNTFVKGIDYPTDPGKICITVPSNAFKMRFSSLERYRNDFSIVIEKGDQTPSYKIPKLLDGKKVELEDDFINTNNLLDESVTSAKCDSSIVKYKKSKNLFNPDAVTTGKFVNWTNGNLQDNETYVSSEFIEIVPGQVINQVHNTHHAFYTDEKVFVSGNRDSQNPAKIVAPSNAKYIRVSIKKELVNEYMLVINAECGEYEAYGYIVDNIVEGKEVFFPTKHEVDKYKASRLYGKKVSWFGTSITQGYAWCRLVNQKFKFNDTNNGVGGTAICKENENSSMCTKNRMLGKYNNVTDPNTGSVTLGGTPIPKDVEIIFIEGGANDWARNWAIGDKKFTPSPNDQTFGGACHLMFKNLTELFPGAEIIIVGSPFGKLKDRASFTNKYGVLNNQNLQTIEYGDILLDIGGKWGAKGFNMGRVMQVHDNNIDELIPDGLHLNTKEVQDMAADAVIDYLLTLN